MEKKKNAQYTFIYPENEKLLVDRSYQTPHKKSIKLYICNQLAVSCKETNDGVRFGLSFIDYVIIIVVYFLPCFVVFAFTSFLFSAQSDGYQLHVIHILLLLAIGALGLLIAVPYTMKFIASFKVNCQYVERAYHTLVEKGRILPAKVTWVNYKMHGKIVYFEIMIGSKINMRSSIYIPNGVCYGVGKGETLAILYHNKKLFTPL